MNLNGTIHIISGKNPLTVKSGYASYSYNLAKILTDLGQRVKIFCVGEKDQIIRSRIGTIYVKGSKLASLPILKNAEMAGLPILSFQLASTLASHLNSNDIIWAVGPWSLSAALLKIFHPKLKLLADYFTSIKHEYSATVSALRVADHGLWIKAQAVFIYLTLVKLYSLLEWFLLEKSNKIITHYESTEKILGRQFKISKNKFIRLPYFIEALKQAVSSPSKLPFKPLIISVLRHDGRKGINFLLHAFALLNKRRVKYSGLIIGEGRLIKAHIKLARKLKLTNISQPGSINNISSYLKRADLFVFPSVEEGGSSLAILEAMKAGLPIVSTNVDGIPEDLEDHKLALLVPSKNPQALADAIHKLLYNHKLAKKLGSNAKKNYYQKYNLSLVKKALKSFLISISRLRS